MKTRIKTHILTGLLAVHAATALGSGPSAGAYRGTDVWRDLRADHHGIAAAFFAAKASAQVARTLKATPAALQAYTFADEVIQKVDFERVLDAPLAITLPDGWRAFNLVGSHQAAGFLVDYRRAALATAAFPQFLDWGADFTVRADPKPLPGEERGFGLGLHGRINTNQFTHHSLARLLTGSLRIAAPTNLPALPQQGPAKAAAKSSSLNDRNVWAELASTLPQSAALLERFVHVKPGLTPTAGSTDIRSEFSLRLEALKARHPDFGEFIETLGEKFAFVVKVHVKLKSGLTLVQAKLDSTAYKLDVHAKTSDGKLVPFTAADIGQPEQAVQLDELKEWQGTIGAELSGKVLGLSFHAPGLEFATNYRDGATAAVTSRLVKMPVPTIEGYALGMLPTWAIDLAMPGSSLEASTKALTAGLLQGSRGKGTFAVITVDSQRPDETRVAAAASTQLIDSFYLNFGLRVVQSYLWPDQDVIADAWHLSQEAAYALEQDLGRLAKLEQGPVAH